MPIQGVASISLNSKDLRLFCSTGTLWASRLYLFGGMGANSQPSCVCASAGLIFLRRLSRPFLRAVQNTGDMDDVASMDINHKVRQRRKHQLARAVHFSPSAYARKLPQLCRGIVDSANHAGGVLG